MRHLAKGLSDRFVPVLDKCQELEVRGKKMILRSKFPDLLENRDRLNLEGLITRSMINMLEDNYNKN